MKFLALVFLSAVLYQQVDTVTVRKQGGKINPAFAYFFGLTGGPATKMRLVMNMGGKDTSKSALIIPSQANNNILSFKLTISPRNSREQILTYSIRNNHLTSAQ